MALKLRGLSSTFPFAATTYGIQTGRCSDDDDGTQRRAQRTELTGALLQSFGVVHSQSQQPKSDDGKPRSQVNSNVSNPGFHDIYPARLRDIYDSLQNADACAAVTSELIALLDKIPAGLADRVLSSALEVKTRHSSIPQLDLPSRKREIELCFQSRG
ncbi:hypothetical protein PLEOSDRAFT_1105385 [Pleurotus ostreatus PC15]|uniref:Uncharacterized protein n=1 Tax=Pleurotus ostreatus (strain PC15) TaxID=1137138 RepID=A0A067NS70_PLEO1|nr:hypothetical protein PLEOSDRAFT_1105385 [Pleurotus ostreatus PC15]